MNNIEKKTQSIEPDSQLTHIIELAGKTVNTAIIRDLQVQPTEELGKSAFPKHPQL